MADLVENITEVNELIFGDLSVPQSRVEALLVKNTNAIKELADILEHIATIETDDTSTHHYEIGEYIIYDGRIYQTLKEINIGDTFEIDVNIKQVVFGDELEGVNDLLEKIKEMFGPVEDGDKASKDYKIGDYVVYKNKLYKVIQNISNGDTFVTEVNIEETTLNEVFNTLIEIIPESSTTKPGLMSAEDKIKLDGIEANANKYTHPAYTARTGVPTANQAPGFGGTFTVTQPVSDSQGHITQMNSRTITIPSATATTTAAGLMSAADKSKLNGVSSANLVPAGGSSGQVLKRDSNGNLTWGTDNNTTYPVATTTTNGLMSSSDKVKLDSAITSSNISSYFTSNKIKSVLCSSNGVVTYASGWTGHAYYSNGFLIIGGSYTGGNYAYHTDELLATVKGNFRPAIGWLYGIMSLQFGDDKNTHIVIPIYMDMDGMSAGTDDKTYIKTYIGFIPKSSSGKDLTGTISYDSRFNIWCPGSYSG